MKEQLRRDALEYHRVPTSGKISVMPTKSLVNQHDLALVYSPGVAYACLAIREDPKEAATLTSRRRSHGDNIPRGATETGAQVAETLSARAREAQVAMRSSREAGLKAMHTMTQNYATLVSGVLIGLSEALEQGKKTKL